MGGELWRWGVEAIALVGTGWLANWRVSARIEAMDAKAEARTSEMRKELTAYIDRMEARVSDRLDRMEGRLPAIVEAAIAKAAKR